MSCFISAPGGYPGNAAVAEVGPDYKNPMWMGTAHRRGRGSPAALAVRQPYCIENGLRELAFDFFTSA